MLDLLIIIVLQKTEFLNIQASITFKEHRLTFYSVLCCTSPDLVGNAADALFPLILCDQGLYQVICINKVVPYHSMNFEVSVDFSFGYDM